MYCYFFTANINRKDECFVDYRVQGNQTKIFIHSNSIRQIFKAILRGKENVVGKPHAIFEGKIKRRSNRVIPLIPW